MKAAIPTWTRAFRRIWFIRLSDFHSETETDHAIAWWDPCAALGTNDGFIIAHGFQVDDFHWAGVPGWPGDLNAEGTQYLVQLMDPTGTTVQHEFAAQMTVIGTNPNEL